MKYSEKKRFYENNEEYYSYEYENYMKFDQIIKESDDEKTNNVDKNQSEFNYESAHIIMLNLILKCRKCNKKFFFNNKLHIHLKTCNKLKNTILLRRDHKLAAAHIITNISVVKSINKIENYHEFVFRTHIYATAKKSLNL